MAAAENLFLMDAAIKAAGELAASGAPDMSAADACAALSSRPYWNLAESIMVNQRDFMEHLSSLDYYNQSLLLDGPIGGQSTQTFLVPGGLGNFIATFAEGLDIVFNMPANVVDTRDANLIKVETDAGTVTARHVVIAVPQSILVKERLKFKPGLSATRMAGLNHLPMFTVDKIGVEFTADVFAPFNDNTAVGQFVASGDRSASIITKFMGKRQASIIFGGDTALEVEAGGMPAFEAYARETIGNVFGTDIANAIGRIAVNPWGTDPWAGGSWTMADVGYANERLEAGKPIDNRIFFAGEPFTKSPYGTTQSAYITGREAAAQILAM
jgi:monoamine oxidase